MAKAQKQQPAETVPEQPNPIQTEKPSAWRKMDDMLFELDGLAATVGRISMSINANDEPDLSMSIQWIHARLVKIHLGLSDAQDGLTDREPKP
jgi:hypothetical protein